MKKAQKGKLRPPVVVVLGHVDHGKTTLLDAIRKTNVAAREAGGITQSIGASTVTSKEAKRITFIDTPGHVAFSQMRSRGATVADIALLVVAATDGVKPQTVEALKYIKDAKIPFIVVVTKMDLPSASVKKIQAQLEKEKVAFEGKGGDVILVKVSAKKTKGLEELLEMISLVAEVAEVSADEKGKLEAVIIETAKDKKGPLTSVIVRNGNIKVGDVIYSEEMSCKVKGLFGSNGKPIKKVLPGEPGQILGFSPLPPVGAFVTDTPNGKKVADSRLEERIDDKESEGFRVLTKAKSAGSLEALLTNLPNGLVVVGSGVGDVNQSDVFLAKASEKAIIVAFGVKAPREVANLAQSEGVRIEVFDVIYEIFEKLEELMSEDTEEVLGKAEILASFPYNKKKVAGGIVLKGRIAKQDRLILQRGKVQIGTARVASLKKQKESVSVVNKGEEFGLILEPQLDFAKGDMLVSVRK